MKAGDSVTLADEDFLGTIISIKGATATVEDRYGFRHQLETSKLIPRTGDLYAGMPAAAKAETTKKISKKNSHSPVILDLHFQNMVPDPERYTPWERLDMQRQKLISMLDYCRKHHLKRLHIIHGIGDGVLQDMVYEVLRGRTGIEFEDQNPFYHSSGSVLVILR